MLNLIVFLPVLSSPAIPLIKSEKRVFHYTLLVTFSVFVFSLSLLKGFSVENPLFQWAQTIQWLPQLGASYHIGIDGISLLLILLTTFLTPISVLASLKSIKSNVKGFCGSLLVLETGMLGVFVSLDLLLFYFFWDLMLVPMYLIIGIWGHERRVYAAFKFILYTLLGSAILLIAIIIIRLKTGTFDLIEASQNMYLIGPNLKRVLFLAFALAFAIKVPLFPFHTWLPDAHVEAPTAGSVLLAGILLKMGVYGFLRFNFLLFPDITSNFASFFMVLGVIGIIYGALMSWVQQDLKKLIAYSSIAHLGFVILGIFTMTPWGLQGGILQMFNHGISTGALFIAAGILYERRHTYSMKNLAGVAKVMPIFSTIFGIVMLSSVGLPGLNGFVGEFLVILGTFKISKTLAFFALLGVIFAAVYLLSMFQKVVFNPAKEKYSTSDLTFREFFVFFPFLVFIFWVGVYPKPFLKLLKKPSQGIITKVTTPEVKVIPDQPEDGK